VDTTSVAALNNPHSDVRFNFSAEPSLEEPIAQQGKGLVVDAKSLPGDFRRSKNRLKISCGIG
jgi:hypothetical protein